MIMVFMISHFYDQRISGNFRIQLMEVRKRTIFQAICWGVYPLKFSPYNGLMYGRYRQKRKSRLSHAYGVSPIVTAVSKSHAVD